ncbi:MAG: hypothetical protein NTV94_18795 [Planctomycetota bacterium]|nr:hypothetical protein [Planctomycetota bacterium]
MTTGTHVKRNTAGGFTLVEAMISALIVATMLVAALNTVGASARAQSTTTTSLRAWHMAGLLMAEIESLPYADPDLIALPLGLDPGELAQDRSTFDDVDDYNAYTAAPATRRDGSLVCADSGWSFAVNVKWVDPAQPDAVAGTLFESNLKRIEVVVAYGGKPVANLMSLKANVN